jgi:hypothetical protein
MSHLSQRICRTALQMQRIAFLLIVPLSAIALLLFQRVGASEDGLAPDAVSKTVTGVPIGRADGVDATDTVCTVSPSFNNMPAMSKTFTQNATTNKPVIVMFEGEWFAGVEGSAAFIQLAIDGVVQSGPRSVVAAFSPFGAIPDTATHGFNFITDALTPGSHTATIQWADNGQGPYCVRVRSMLILHK